MLHAFAYVNGLFITQYPDPLPQQNLWAVLKNKRIDYGFISTGLVEVGNLPLLNGSIDWRQIQSLMPPSKRGFVFLTVASLQEKFHFPLGWPCLEKKFPSKIGKYAKKLLKKQLWSPPTLTKWEIALVIPPLLVTDVCLINKQMITKCKISKLQDCNYKILHRILATPVVIAAVQKQPELKLCVW